MSLFDLDELTLKCRSPASRALVREAVLAYSVGAYRASIVSTWIAVFNDLVEKIRELSIAGERSAEILLAQFETAYTSSNIPAILKFEREALSNCYNSLQMFSESEYTDLGRIQADRNRCAHPALGAASEIFSPPPDLARTHIVNAVTGLIMHEPSQGQPALERILRDVRSELFPAKPQKAKEFLLSSPLRRARASLFRSFVIVQIKDFLNSDDYSERGRASAALQAASDIDNNSFVRILASDLSRIVSGISDDRLVNALRLILVFKDEWRLLGSDQKIRIESFVERLPSSELDLLDVLESYAPLAGSAKIRANRVTATEIDNSFFFVLPSLVRESVISDLEHSWSFERSNSICKAIFPYLVDFTDDQCMRILAVGEKNSQVGEAFDFRGVKQKINAHLKKEQA